MSFKQTIFQIQGTRPGPKADPTREQRQLVYTRP